MATRNKRQIRNRAQFVVAGLRWYMTNNKLDTLIRLVATCGLVGGGFYTASLGQSVTATVAFAGVTVVNAEIARIFYHATRTQPPQYNDEGWSDANDQDEEFEIRRKND